ncbi:prepilin-type N-terminal cleavage/methylation domain-containing protein [Aliidiomarina quisquiliarum]|uniref:prepilin-type N-terminal cleavage/methylation domain-containing protein n=1 Tax=Aliidiomarina quisquiliarum TaxID=2938947 RepID=UPI00237CFB72|nr:prepilin-type N-terminal cleavage/methylation domain-containing protein [Aliidiomarina quisquiliarum]
MKQQKGFTLIELIIVIVILGILAVTAAPRFFDFSKDARISTIGGLKAAIQGASQIGYANNAITNGSATYPTAAEIADAAQISATDWNIGAVSGTTPAVIIISAKNNAGTGARADCNVTYTEGATLADAPTIVATVSGC